ncbi:MAG: archaetidylserine decarboxylase [Thiohalomonadaceae bacterium]
MEQADTVATPVQDRLKTWPQYLMPGHLLSRLMQALTRIRWTRFRQPFTNWFIKRFQVDMSEAAESDPLAYPHFNAFFTRALKTDARPITDGIYDIACPVDGAVSQVGKITNGRLFQAKDHEYSLLELLGASEKMAAQFQDGHFATLYLSPRDYHRIHMPVDGQLREMVHIPGRLFSVNAATARNIPRLFARNERVVALFDTAAGPMAMVLVGAVFVGNIETVWHGVVTPPAGRIIRRWHYTDDTRTIQLKRGEEMGRFNMGSTVILLFGANAIDWLNILESGNSLRMGQLLATRHTEDNIKTSPA